MSSALQSTDDEDEMYKKDNKLNQSLKALLKNITSTLVRAAYFSAIQFGNSNGNRNSSENYNMKMGEQGAAGRATSGASPER